MLRWLGPAAAVAMFFVLGRANVPDDWRFVICLAVGFGVDFVVSRLFGPRASFLWWWLLTNPDAFRRNKGA